MSWSPDNELFSQHRIAQLISDAVDRPRSSGSRCDPYVLVTGLLEAKHFKSLESDAGAAADGTVGAYQATVFCYPGCESGHLQFSSVVAVPGISPSGQSITLLSFDSAPFSDADTMEMFSGPTWDSVSEITEILDRLALLAGAATSIIQLQDAGVVLRHAGFKTSKSLHKTQEWR